MSLNHIYIVTVTAILECSGETKNKPFNLITMKNHGTFFPQTYN